MFNGIKSLFSFKRDAHFLHGTTGKRAYGLKVVETQMEKYLDLKRKEVEDMITTFIPQKINVLIEKISLVSEQVHIGKINNTSTSHSQKGVNAKNLKRRRRNDERSHNDVRDLYEITEESFGTYINPNWLANELFVFIYEMRFYRAHVSSIGLEYSELEAILKDFEDGAFEALNSLESFILRENTHSETRPRDGKKSEECIELDSINIHRISLQAYCLSVLITVVENYITILRYSA